MKNLRVRKKIVYVKSLPSTSFSIWQNKACQVDLKCVFVKWVVGMFVNLT